MKRTVILVCCIAVFLLIAQFFPSFQEPLRGSSSIYARAIPAGTSSINRFAGKKILWVSSYHRGYEANDDIERGLHASLLGSGAVLETFYMDTKRHNSEKFGEQAGRNAFAFINEYKPDVVIASDDNAQKFLVVPYLKNSTIPVVFCGVNWDADKYGYPAANVTGMVEVDLVQEMYDLMRRHASGDRIGYLSGDVGIERAIVDIYNKQFFHGQMKSYMVSSMDEFKEKFLEAQQQVDMLYVYNYTGIHDWDPGEAELFLSRHTRIPTGSHNGFMAPFVTFVVAKSLEEHGEWAGRTAMEILAGTEIEDISLTRNRKAELYVNMRMAKAASIVLPVSILKTATVVAKDKAFLDPEPDSYQSNQYAGKKIFWLDSYNTDYEWSVGLEAGIRGVLYDSGATLQVFHMDTKNHIGEQYGRSIGQKAYEAIRKEDPDVVIASDDNAQTYVVVPYLLGKKLPVVYCGVNWDAKQYGYPADNITGMLEVEAVDELVHYLNLYARGDRVGMISGNLPTDQKLQSVYNERYFSGKFVSYFVSTLEEFELAVLRAQTEVDMLIFANYAGISGWDEEKVAAFILEHNRLPTGTPLAFMADYAVFTVAKVAEEQGSYAARTALRIMDGKSPAFMPVEMNKLHELTINIEMASGAGIVVPFHLLKQATVIGNAPEPSLQ